MAHLTPEKKVQTAIIDYVEQLKEEGVPVRYFRRCATDPNYQKGLPDLYLVWGPRHIEVEVKAPGGHLSTMQEKWRDRFIKMGTPWMCCDSLDDFKDKTKEYLP